MSTSPSRGPRDAPVLVLAPSLGTRAAMWSPQLLQFATRFRVVSVELRGHVSSDVPVGPYDVGDLGRDVLAQLDNLGIERFSYCGISLGGMVGMWLAAHTPDRIERLALCCTSAYLPPAQGWLDRAATVRRSGLAAVADRVVGRWFTPAFADASPDVVTRARDMLLTIPPEGYAGCCEALATMDLRPMLSVITAPTLVLAGEQDAAIPLPHAKVLVSGIPNARLAVVADAAHLAPMQEPALCTQLLLDHLGGTP